MLTEKRPLPSTGHQQWQGAFRQLFSVAIPL